MNSLNTWVSSLANKEMRTLGQELTAGLYKAGHASPDSNRDNLILCIDLDPEFLKSEDFRRYKKKVLITSVYGTLIKNSAVKMMNRFDIVIVNSLSCMKQLIRNGVYKPIKVVSGFYSTSILDVHKDSKLETVLSQDIAEKMVFLHVSECETKDNLGLVLRSYIKAFSDTNKHDKVVLIVKGPPHHDVSFEMVEAIKEEAMALQRQYSDPAKIVKLSCELNMKDSSWLKQRADVFLNSSSVENFNPTLLEGLLLDKAVVALKNKNSGYVDYLNEYNSYLVNARLEKSEADYQWLYSKGNKCAYVEDDIYSDMLKHVYNEVKGNRARKLSLNKREADRTFKQFSFDKVLADYATILKTINQKETNGN